MHSVISHIEMSLGSKLVTNAELVKGRPDYSDEKIRNKIGVSQRYVCAEDEYASDIGIRAGIKLLDNVDKKDIEFFIYCTQSPDHSIPTTACVIHEKLGLKKNCGTIEINLGCSGWVYAIGVAHSLICSGMAKRVLVICADTYSRYIDEHDIPNRSIFGDGASATLVEADNGRDGIFQISNSFEFGTDGSGADFLSVQTSGLKGSPSGIPLYMNGMEIYKFCIREIPKLRDSLLSRAGLIESDINKYVFHQASKTMLDALAYKMNIEEHRLVRSMENTGNTVSSTIPIALKSAIEEGSVFKNDVLMCLGFGVGLSWSGLLLRKR